MRRWGTPGRIREIRHVPARLTLWQMGNLATRKLSWTASSMASVSTCFKGGKGGETMPVTFFATEDIGCCVSQSRWRWSGNSLARRQTCGVLHWKRSSVLFVAVFLHLGLLARSHVSVGAFVH